MLSGVLVVTCLLIPLLLYSTTLDGEYISNSISWVINVVADDYVPFEIVTEGLMCNFDATFNKSQTSGGRNIWTDDSGNNVKCELFNFNYSTNGWMDNSLVFNGKTYAKIDFSPFAENVKNGKIPQNGETPIHVREVMKNYRALA